MGRIANNPAAMSDAEARTLLHHLLGNVDVIGHGADGTAFCMVTLPPAILDRLAVRDADGDADIEDGNDRELDLADMEENGDLEPDQLAIALAWSIRNRWVGPRHTHAVLDPSIGRDGVRRIVPQFQDITARRATT